MKTLLWLISINERWASAARYRSRLAAFPDCRSEFESPYRLYRNLEMNANQWPLLNESVREIEKDGRPPPSRNFPDANFYRQRVQEGEDDRSCHHASELTTTELTVSMCISSPLQL